MAFPKILICLNCGFAEFQVPTAELQRLAEGFAETSNGTKRRSTKRQKSAWATTAPPAEKPTDSNANEPSTFYIRIRHCAGFIVIDSKGEAARADQLWGTTREQVFDQENGIRDQWSVKTKELVSAEGIEPSTYW